MSSAIKEAEKVVNERQTSYDKPENNFRRIKIVWNGHLKAKYDTDLELDEEDVAFMNVLQKMARNYWKKKFDNYVDIIGYAECAWRLNQVPETVLNKVPIDDE